MVNREEKSAEQAQNLSSSGDNDSENDVQAKGGFITFLSKMDEHDMLTEEGLAEGFGVSARTIRRMIERRQIPKPLLLAGRKVWKVGAIIAHLDMMSRITLKEAETLRKNQTL